MITIKALSLYLFMIVAINLSNSNLIKPRRYYKTLKFEVPLDHFNFGNNQTFQIKYLLNDTYWNQDNGPIFFYTGNEGLIELFANVTGFMWEIAEEFKALIVFAEHRYYGESMPFANKSFSEPQYSGYLSTTQALADYVDLITSLQKNNGKKHPVIVFGGSYGGMLSAYIRMKYPHIVDGAIAASAPVHQFTGMIPCDAFYRITTSVFTSQNKNCSDNIRKSWKEIRNLVSTPDGKKWLSKEWKLCNLLNADNDTEALISYLSNAYTTLAMANYPYENNFLAELPGYPVREFCTYLRNVSLTGKPLLKAFHLAVSVYSNYTHKAHCLDYSGADQSGLGDEGWDYQSCTEMVMPMCSNGVTDMFEKNEWDEKKVSAECKKKFGVTPDFGLAEKEYGGDRLEAASNIVFSNGLLDPWASGGLMKNYSQSTYVVLIPEGAHHLDLMSANQNDPYSVRFARNIHKYFIKKWIDEKQNH